MTYYVNCDRWIYCVRPGLVAEVKYNLKEMVSSTTGSYLQHQGTWTLLHCVRFLDHSALVVLNSVHFMDSG